MAFLTSYRFKSVELNDGINYAIPLADLGLDDSNSVAADWVYRTGNVPAQTQLTIKEGVFVLNINILPQATASAWEAKLDQLKRIFDTRDPAFYSLERQLSHESVYRYLSVAPREFVVNRAERRASVTFHTPDKVWKGLVERSASILLFETAARTETLAVTYNGSSPTEPRIVISAGSAGSDGPVPLYWRNVDVYMFSAQAAVGFPLQIVTGWNTNTLVSGGKMRSDGLDITVNLPGYGNLPRYVGGSQASRSVWVLPSSWPGLVGGTLRASITSGSMSAYIFFDSAPNFPTSGKFMLDDEVISYNGVTTVEQPGVPSGHYVQVTFTARGVDGTSAASHGLFTRIKRATTLKVGYGYAAGYLQVYPNDLSNWPLLDYEQSNNSTWVQATANTWPYGASGASFFPSRAFAWATLQDLFYPTRQWEYITAASDVDPAGGTGKMQFTTQYTPGVGSSARHRIAWQAPPDMAHIASSVRFNLSFLGGAFTVKLYKARRNFMQSTEEAIEIWSYSYNGTPTTIDTGYIATNQWNAAGSHYFFRIESAAPGGPTVALKLNTVYFQMDSEYGRRTSVSAISSEQGASVSEYPVYLSSIRNLTDTGNPQTFSLTTYMQTGNQATINCEQHTVSGMELNECSYSNGIWLRLLPGANSVQFVGPQGAGQMTVTLYWYEKY